MNESKNFDVTIIHTYTYTIVHYKIQSPTLTPFCYLMNESTNLKSFHQPITNKYHGTTNQSLIMCECNGPYVSNGSIYFVLFLSISCYLYLAFIYASDRISAYGFQWLPFYAPRYCTHRWVLKVTWYCLSAAPVHIVSQSKHLLVSAFIVLSYIYINYLFVCTVSVSLTGSSSHLVLQWWYCTAIIVYYLIVVSIWVTSEWDLALSNQSINCSTWTILSIEPYKMHATIAWS
jgi:hypothetical protein